MDTLIHITQKEDNAKEKRKESNKRQYNDKFKTNEAFLSRLDHSFKSKWKQDKFIPKIYTQSIKHMAHVKVGE